MSYKTKYTGQDFMLTMEVNGAPVTLSARGWAQTEHCQKRKITKDMLCQRVLKLRWTDWQALNVPRVDNGMSGREKNIIREKYGLKPLERTKYIHPPKDRRRPLKGKALDAAISQWAMNWKDWLI